ncbi:MAG: hypothetical protein QMD85_03705 [Candidatus Aenigmarchaeota archaeon]|nr:hypothetical protein [Candidatus Aenigmarchaeota archaeon]MDI6722666.1 hypothetical protein [Candidatus Aenigmarchaeota archaeon]
MAGPFDVLISNMSQLGVFGFLLPWIFVFAVTYALLLKTKALGENQKIIGLVSLTLAFFVIAFGGPAMASFFTTFFGAVTLIIAGIIGIILFLALVGADIGKTLNTKGINAILVGIAIIIFVIALGAYGVRINDNIIGIVFVLALMGIAVMFVTKNG